MLTDYKTVASGEWGGSNFHLGLIVQAAFSRDLTDDERFTISNHLNDICKLLRKNNLLNDKEYMGGIADAKARLLECFGTQAGYVRELPNEYYSESLEPWYEVYTRKGPIKIGWRKRVINIDWSNSEIKMKPEDVTDDDVTKGDKVQRYIHAWSYEKAKEYITKLLQ